jgi:hypothetical protein
MANVLFGSSEYSGLGIYQRVQSAGAQDSGKIVFFLLYVVVGEVGKTLDNEYVCPVYCGVDHKHRIIENEAKTKQRLNKETDIRISRSAIISDRNK